MSTFFFHCLSSFYHTSLSCQGPTNSLGRERRLSRLSYGSTIQQEPKVTSLTMLSQDVRLSPLAAPNPLRSAKLIFPGANHV